MATSDFRFRPPTRRLIWKRLALTMSQAANLTGVSERQIQHWMDKGYIGPSADGARKISGETLDVIMLIKQARAAGIPLRQAVPMAHSYLTQEAAGAFDSDMAHAALHELQERLATLRASMDAVQALIHDVGMTDEEKARSILPLMVADVV